MQEELSIRECGQEEAQSLLALWRKAGATAGVTDTVEDIQRVIRHSAAIVLVAEQDGHIVGTVIGTFDGWRGNIYRLAVDPDCRRQGLARKLVDEVDKRFASRGVKPVTALVEKTIPGPWASGIPRDTSTTKRSSATCGTLELPNNQPSPEAMADNFAINGLTVADC